MTAARQGEVFGSLPEVQRLLEAVPEEGGYDLEMTIGDEVTERHLTDRLPEEAARGWRRPRV